ncbi:uncharacterized protein LOC131041891 [Cryptomeria japonica]|uniref:uncharacterized protein LOC131041891 n=1 Tax=Cryptomeria japonica TaxID=3369 RepID=UPI0025ABCB46|nr:uncharacterized protein LOC131041891 [Cryptomeria japonica]
MHKVAQANREDEKETEIGKPDEAFDDEGEPTTEEVDTIDVDMLDDEHATPDTEKEKLDKEEAEKKKLDKERADKEKPENGPTTPDEIEAYEENEQARVKLAKMRAAKGDTKGRYENLRMEEDEDITSYFHKVDSVVNEI